MLFVDDFTVEMASEYTAKVLFSVPKCKKAVICDVTFGENTGIR